MSSWPPWTIHLFRSAITVGVAYGLGLVLNRIIASRLARLVSRTPGDWDDVLVGELKRRIPFWSLLIGGYLSLTHWPFNPELHLLLARVLSALGVASFTLAAAAVATRLAATYGPRTSPSAPVTGITLNIVRIVVMVLGTLVIVRSFDYDITPILTALGVGGLAVALALQEPLSNLFAGIFVTLAGQVRLGDYVKLDSGAEGYVIDFNWRSARLAQLGDNIIVVPNSKLAQAIVTNYSLPATDIGTGLDLVIDWTNDLTAVERIALEVVTAVVSDTPGAVKSAAPSVKFQAFTETGVKMSVGFRVQSFVDQFGVKHEIVKRLHARFRAEGITLPVQPYAIAQRPGLDHPA